MLSFDYDRTSNVFGDVNVGVQNYNFKFPLIWDQYNIIIVVRNLKFIQEFTSAINVKCLHSSLQAKLLMHNCARAKTAKKQGFSKFPVERKISTYDAHIHEQ